MADDTHKYWSASELAHAGGPVGRLVAQEVGAENILNIPKSKAWQKKHGAAGLANVRPTLEIGPFKFLLPGRDIVSKKTGLPMKKGQAHVFNRDPLTAVHEGMHMLQRIPEKTARRPDWKPQPASASEDHPWIEANELYNARNKAEYDRNLASHSFYMAATDTQKIAADNMAAAEYDLGARLMYDPSRGHNVVQSFQAAFESVGGGKAERDTYIKYRNQQSYVGRGNKEPWEFYRK